MPRLSLWKEGRHTNDYKFMDRIVSEQFTVGGTGVLVHKYLGTNEQNLIKNTSGNQGTISSTLSFSSTSDIDLGMYVIANVINSGTKVISKTANTVTLSANTLSAITSNTSIKFYTSPTEPSYINQSDKNIQDLLFLENRDRRYDTSVYSLRGHYPVQDSLFDLSQFGMLLQPGTNVMTFHINDMVAVLGRKIMAGDVLELLHLKDYYPLDDTLPVALKRYYVVSDCTNAAEGFSPTWWPHLWRVKLNPLTDSQEYKDIINQIKVDEEIPGSGTGTVALANVSSIIQKYQEVNNAILREAEYYVPYSGYDISTFYTTAYNDSDPGEPTGITTDGNLTADSGSMSADSGIYSPEYTYEGYLVGTGIPPNGLPVATGIAFPTNPQAGDYALRTDYLPNRLFRYDGTKWIKIEDNLRANLTPGSNNKTVRSNFINDTDTFTNNSGNITVRQSLSKALRAKADN